MQIGSDNCVMSANGITEALQLLQPNKILPELQTFCVVELCSIAHEIIVVNITITGTKINTKETNE